MWRFSSNPSYHLLKHVSAYTCTRDFVVEKGVHWSKTPAESPDLNPIENLWHELKEFIRREVKRKTKEELIKGIEKFWDQVIVERCNKYVNHLRIVIPRVIELGRC